VERRAFEEEEGLLHDRVRGLALGGHAAGRMAEEASLARVNPALRRAVPEGTAARELRSRGFETYSP
jgi:hypothetical protein